MPTTSDIPAILAVPGTPSVPATAGTPPIPATATTAAIPRTFGTAAIYGTLSIPGAPAKRIKPLKGALTKIDEIVTVIRQHSATVETRGDSPRGDSFIVLESPKVLLVLEKLPSYQIIHFACHGVTSVRSPSTSHLLLAPDGDVGPGQLTVAKVASMNIERAQIAYLSACSTADNVSIPLADESIHIACGFQLAGFSHVLATMWSANDQACRQVAVEFYLQLFSVELQGVAGHKAVSTAFHRAVKKLRDKNLGLPIMWACFIHTGA